MNSVPTRSRAISMPSPHSLFMRAAVLLACSFLVPAFAQSPAVKRLQVYTPRAFGYVIGDVFRHRVRVELKAPYRLETESLPARGKINRWLEMRSRVLELSRSPEATEYEIAFDYQIFNAPSVVQRVRTPAHELIAAGPADRFAVVIPAWEFSVAPIISSSAADGESPVAVRPPRPPPPIPLAPYMARFALALVIFAAALLYLCWLRWGVPILSRANRPFARAYRDLKRLSRQPFDQSVYRQALRRMHGAFNETDGRALFSEQLEAFHARHQRFGGLERPIEWLFVESQSVFFAVGDPALADQSRLSHIVGLCRECRERERRPA
jgi:mxaA protein